MFFYIEICGDGVNLGQVECDDGNKINNDGCSTTCKVENGYKCIVQGDKPDLCYDVMAPSAELKVTKGNVLRVKFSEPIRVRANSMKGTLYRNRYKTIRNDDRDLGRIKRILSNEVDNKRYVRHQCYTYPTYNQNLDRLQHFRRISNIYREFH